MPAKKTGKSFDMEDIHLLLEKSNATIKKVKNLEKIKKKADLGCKKCSKKPIYHAGHCKECDAEIRNTREKAAFGKRWVSTNGYEYTYVKRTGMKPVLYHRARMEELIGRPLQEHETVTHIDGDKLNNEDSNLMIVLKKGINLSELKCPHCSELYFPINSFNAELAAE